MISTALDFIRADYHSHKFRLCAEVLGMVISLIVAVIIAMTTPLPPMLWCYTLWMIASTLLVGASISRHSTGFVALYGSFLIIDGIGLLRTILV